MTYGYNRLLHLSSGVRTGTDPYEFAATSKYRNDGDAGLVLVGARYYDPQAGAFISRDTYLDQLPYVYCDGDPVNGVDPGGHERYVAPGKPATDADHEQMAHLGNLIEITAVVVGVFCPPAGGVIAIIGAPLVIVSEAHALQESIDRANRSYPFGPVRVRASPPEVEIPE